MDFTKHKNTYLIKLEKGELIQKTLHNFALAESLQAGWVQGIGVLKDPELGFYQSSSKDYLKKTFEGEWEILSLNGNLTTKDHQAFMHCHISLSGPDFQCIGGHLFEATIAAAGELLFQPFPFQINREFDEETGLHLLDL